MTVPFDYPPSAHERRHGPAGYADYASYRPWLRDEFEFRCVFCLRREIWGTRSGEFAVDHFEPVSVQPDRVTDYDNLLYVCGPCNLRKGDVLIPDPLVALVSSAVDVRRDGTVVPRTPEALRVVDLLQLDHPTLTAFRAMWIELVRLAADHDAGLHRRLLAYPADLPDLRALRPPGGNARPEGVELSHFRRRQRGELPATY